MWRLSHIRIAQSTKNKEHAASVRLNAVGACKLAPERSDTSSPDTSSPERLDNSSLQRAQKRCINLLARAHISFKNSEPDRPCTLCSSRRATRRLQVFVVRMPKSAIALASSLFKMILASQRRASAPRTPSLSSTRASKSIRVCPHALCAIITLPRLHTIRTSQPVTCSQTSLLAFLHVDVLDAQCLTPF